MRRWNGWGDDGIDVTLPPFARELLESVVGPATPPTGATFDEAVAAVGASRIDEEAGLDLDPGRRLRHARGQSLPDWIALRSGRIGRVPDAVATPADSAAAGELLARARTAGWTVIPFGGGTSVVGGVTPGDDDRPVVTVDLGGQAGLRDLDERAGLATFGAGTTGPAVEAALEPFGLTLGHFPQSFEYSTVGGWVAARSAGQESLGYGRIEALYAGGRVETPSGPLTLPTHPASAAGPDRRAWVLGSEGRLGIITDVTLRVVPRPAHHVVRAYSLPDWDRGLEVTRDLARSGLALQLVRLATPAETRSTLALADDRARQWLGRYLRWRGHGPEAALLLVGIAGATGVLRAVEGEVARLVKRGRGIGVPGVGSAWRRDRFRGPYLRNALWDAGYAADTLETAIDWSGLPALAAALTPGLRRGLEADGERVHAFSHLSHVYPSGTSLYVTYLYRLSPDPDETLDRWRRLKTLASETIVAHGGTISHQHGVGRDHAPYLAVEAGELGIHGLRELTRAFDPDGVMHPGVLLAADPPR
jgi:alkyldihydroxyacetonephosphate synthase